ncbi:PilW family protein [Myxococcus stipitatus]|uniref:PilW family protein n=1 Tax=Myxococcus stipitatus TaxID=83455 RepID=UPI003CD04B3E
MSSGESRGFTLLEVMIASAIGVIVLGIGLVAGMQMQRRALFEEQTMVAQSTGRAVKDLLASDVARAGMGMGNAPITFSDGDRRFAIQVWNELDMTTAHAPVFAADPSFELPPTGPLYGDMRSDVLQLYWGDTRTLVNMAPCSPAGNLPGETGPIRTGNSSTFCTALNSPTTLQPPNGQTTPAILVNPQGSVACHIEISQVQPASNRINANPGRANNSTSSGACGDAGHADWRKAGWLTMGTVSAAYRVNWASGIPTLEYLAPGATTWVPISRDVERLKIRQAVIDFGAPGNPYRWFPDDSVSRPSIDTCTRDKAACVADTSAGTNPGSDAELRDMLRERVRELEISLVIRTPRSDPSIVNPYQREEGFPMDGFKRRTFTFRVTPRNFVSAGKQPTGT